MVAGDLDAMVIGDSDRFSIGKSFDFTNLNSALRLEPGGISPATAKIKGHKVLSAGRLHSPDIAPHKSGSVNLALPASRLRADVLYLTAVDPGGRELWTWSWSLRAMNVGPATSGPALQVTEGQQFVSIHSNGSEFSISKETGAVIEAVNRGSKIPLTGGPRLIAFRRNDRKYENVAGNSRLTHFESRKEGKSIVVETSYEGAFKYVRWRVSPDGRMGLVAVLDYEYSFDGPVDILGIQFESEEKEIRGIRWLGMGPYRVWQNRLQGTRLDVWQNGYNDSTPGESWIYPEFKGYFRDVRWARFLTRSGTLTLGCETPNSYLGLFKPSDGVNGLLEFPNVGIAVLDVIPAIRNKFHTTDEIGPQSQTKKVSGTINRTIELRF